MEKNSSLAKISFVIGLFFWLPLFNLILGPVAVIIGIKALLLWKSNPSKYGGKRWAIFGIVLGALPIIFYVAGLLV